MLGYLIMFLYSNDRAYVYLQAQLLTVIHHRNLVSLVGFCDENDVKALIYEYMDLGDLGRLLSGLSCIHICRTSHNLWRNNWRIIIRSVRVLLPDLRALIPYPNTNTRTHDLSKSGTDNLELQMILCPHNPKVTRTLVWFAQWIASTL